MGILLWILFGAIVGLIVSLLARTGGSLLTDIILGILGAVVGGWVMHFFGKPGATGFNLYSIIVSVLGALILIWIVRAITK